MVQELLEEEAKDFLGRDHYQRRKEDQRGYRNGYEPFEVNTAEGRVTVYKPQLRDTDRPFRSKLSAFLKNNSEVLKKLAIEMYARGLSTRDIEDALLEATGEKILSRTSVSKVTEILWEEFEDFRNRDLSALRCSICLWMPSTKASGAGLGSRRRCSAPGA